MKCYKIKLKSKNYCLDSPKPVTITRRIFSFSVNNPKHGKKLLNKINQLNIDENLTLIIIKLNNLGYITQWSCAGNHINCTRYKRGYITFDKLYLPCQLFKTLSELKRKKFDYDYIYRFKQTYDLLTTVTFTGLGGKSSENDYEHS